MIYKAIGTFLALVVSSASGKVYFKEDFNDAGWKSRWTVSDMGGKPSSEIGEWAHTAGNHFGDASDKGIQTSEDARFYGISAKMDEGFTNTGKDLVVQFTVKHEQDLDCGGAYLKLMGPNVDQKTFGGETPYQIMFGPDICGYSNRKTHAIFHYEPKSDNLLIKKELKVETDKLTHLYTLHVKSDNTFEVFIDQESTRTGNLEDEWDFLLPKEIKVGLSLSLSLTLLLWHNLCPFSRLLHVMLLLYPNRIICALFFFLLYFMILSCANPNPNPNPNQGSGNLQAS